MIGEALDEICVTNAFRLRVWLGPNKSIQSIRREIQVTNAFRLRVWLGRGL